MKKLFALLLALVLILPAAALADLPDLSGLTYDELVQLRQKINLAIWNSEEWQEVTVPPGIWKIGEDIPAGKWCLVVSQNSGIPYASFTYCSKLNKSGLDADDDAEINEYVTLNNKTNNDGKRATFSIVDFLPDTYIIIEYAPIVFMPPAMKPDLGFK